MMYYDDYEEIQDLYEEHEEPVYLVSEECRENDITELLVNMGFFTDSRPVMADSMEKIVFLYGNSSEVYSSEEIEFTREIENVYIYPEFFKNLNSGRMICRVIAAQINYDGKEAVKACVSFEKIMNKAFDGFNIYFFVNKSGICFGCRTFDKTGMHNCILSKVIEKQRDLEAYFDEFSTIAITDNFIDLYEQYQQVIFGESIDENDYESMLLKKRGIQSAYIEEIDKIEKDTGIDMSKEMERYIHLFDEDMETSFYELFEEVEEELSFIKSNRVNTYELMFEAEEMMRQAEKAEAERTEVLEKFSNTLADEERYINEQMETALDDPEELIKLLKRSKGL